MTSRAEARRLAVQLAEELADRTGVGRHQIQVWIRIELERGARRALKDRKATPDGQFTLHPFFDAPARRASKTTARTQAQASDMDAFHALAKHPSWTPERSFHAVVGWHGFSETCEILAVDRLAALGWVRAGKVAPEFVAAVFAEFAKLPARSRSAAGRGARHGTIREKVLAHSSLTLRAAAELLGVSPQTVMRVRQQAAREKRGG